MPSRKRSLQAVDDDDGVTNRPRSTELLDRIRNMWQFANVCQWIYIFGKAAKIDESIDVEKMEVECLKPHSTLLADVALSILKLVSSHRGLTHDIFDDQIRKQYLAKSPKNNPFGSDRDPRSFADFDVFTKVKVLQQLTQWTLVHPERLREKMEEQKDTEQAGWRIEPYGWDREDRTYYVLDDNRVYRLTETPPAPPRPKTKKAKTYRAGRRSSKRQRVTSPAESAAEDMAEGELGAGPADDGLGGNIWECVAVTLEEVRAFLESLGKTRDENERVLRRQLQLHLVPILEKQEEAQKRKQQQRERELLNLAKMANAKRSSRIAGKAERQRQEEQEREEEEHKREEEASRKREERERLKMEKERDFRMFSRQRRLQEREARRLQHEEELAQLSEDGKTGPTAQGRISERRLLAEIEKNKQALRDLEEEEEAWIFDCVCGLYGQVDDGTHSVACERCNVWQHSKCLGISEGEADRPDFHFVCNPCQRQDEAGKAAPRSVIKLKLHPSATGTTNGTQSAKGPTPDVPGSKLFVSSTTPSDMQASSAVPSEVRLQPRDPISPLPPSTTPHIQAASPAAPTSLSVSLAPTPVPIAHDSPLRQERNLERLQTTKAVTYSAPGTAVPPPLEHNGVSKANSAQKRVDAPHVSGPEAKNLQTGPPNSTTGTSPVPASTATDSSMQPSPAPMAFVSSGVERTSPTREAKTADIDTPTLADEHRPESVGSPVIGLAGPASQASIPNPAGEVIQLASGAWVPLAVNPVGLP